MSLHLIRRHRSASFLGLIPALAGLSGCCGPAPKPPETAPAPPVVDASVQKAPPVVVEAPKEVGPEWSNPRTATLTSEFAGVHGLFNAEPVSVTLRRLPEHAYVTVKFDLLLTGSWDGSFLPWGPDLWTFQVRGGPQLMMTSFSSMGARSANYVQAYPDDYPWGLHYAYTGAVPLDGRPFREPGESGMAVSRARYPIAVSFPHRGSELTLDFGAMFDDPPNSQCWAISGFEYSVSSEPVTMDDAEIDGLWETLGGDDSVAANVAMWKLISGGEPVAKAIAAKCASLEALEDSRYNTPEGLRMRRAQKVLRIAGDEAAKGVGSELTYRLPEMNRSTPKTSE